MNVYKPNEVEAKWQKIWEDNNQYKTDTMTQQNQSTMH